MAVKGLELLDNEAGFDREKFAELYQKHENERLRVRQDPWRLKYHLMPEIGWLNDPNGLCQYQGKYHIYYQYSPFDTDGTMKMWGHITTYDMIHFRQEDVALFPDSCADEHGVYSGAAFVVGDRIHYFYTGNVKYTDKKYDYIHNGREQNVIHVESKDGYH